jgi:hypothetical protein
VNRLQESLLDEDENPAMQAGAAAMPPVLGAGCLSRFDPDALNSQSGSDYAEAPRLLALLRQQAGESG